MRLDSDILNRHVVVLVHDTRHVSRDVELADLKSWADDNDWLVKEG